jgi:hypothetical protein
MLIAEARVETERASRYLVQLCQHVDKLGRARPQMQAHAECSDDRGVISVGWGQCTLRALPGVLTLRARLPTRTPCGGSSTPSALASWGSAGTIT